MRRFQLRIRRCQEGMKRFQLKIGHSQPRIRRFKLKIRHIQDGMRYSQLRMRRFQLEIRRLDLKKAEILKKRHIGAKGQRSGVSTRVRKFAGMTVLRFS